MIQTESASAAEANILARVEGKGFAARVYFSPQNQRIQVLNYEAEDAEAMVADLEAKAREIGFDKVFLKAPAVDKPRLERAGMCEEAIIEGYFNGQPAVVMSLFLSSDRRRRPFAEKQLQILEKIRQRPADSSVPKLPEGYEMSRAEIQDTSEVARLYREVFASYPFPITEPEYIASTMRSNVLYRVVRNAEGRVVGAASAETAPDLKNAEMTDFATLPDQRGLGLAQHLLAALEDDMAERDILNLYTVARARSAGMNRVFYNRDYALTGTLVNNCHIAGQFEDMHVWCKSLEPVAQN
ncbi:MAG: putative beta-lysine N-acetyltransferase [Acidobacteriota bacterium]